MKRPLEYRMRFLACALLLLVMALPARAADSNAERDYEIALAKGEYEIELGNYAAAVEHLKRALAIMPKGREARVTLGIAYRRSGDTQNARIVLEQAVAADPNDARAKYELALVLSGMGRQDEAERLMRAVAETSRDEELLAAAQGFLSGRGAPKGASLRIAAGAQYDSNVILEQDNPVAPPPGEGKSDWRGVLLLDGRLPFLTAERRGLEAAYQFYQSLHGKLEDFNVQSHLARLAGHASWSETGRFDLAYEFNYASLGGDHYSTSHRVAPSLAFRLYEGSRTELFGAYEAKRYFNSAVYTTLTARNGTNGSAGVSHSVMLTGRTGVALAYTYDTDDVEVRHWDYTGNRGTVSLLTEAGAYRLYASFGYHDRKYGAPLPGATVKRHDATQTVSAGVSRRTAGGLTISLSDQYTFNDSNLAIYEYTRNIVGLFAEMTF